MKRVEMGRKIHSTRREQGLTSEALSELCDLNPVFIRQIESGVKLPALPNFVKICEALKVSPNYLLADSIEVRDNEFEETIKKLRSLTPNQLSFTNAMLDTIISSLGE